MKQFIILLIFLFSFTHIFGKRSDEKDSIHIKTIVDIEISAFKYLFKHNASAIQDQASYYYLDITDSTNNTLYLVIQSLKKHTPKVKDMNEYVLLTEEEKEKIKYLSFLIHSVKISGNKAQVDCGYYEGNLSSSENLLILVKKRRKWKVLKDDMLWISSIKNKINDLVLYMNEIGESI